MKPSEIAEGKYNYIDVIDYLQGKPQNSIKKFLDDMVGEACLLSVGMTGVPQDSHKAKRLFDIVELVSEALLPNYPSRQGVGYEKQDAGCGGSLPTDFLTENVPPKDRLPKELKTDKALMFWQKAVEVGFVDKNFNLKGTITFNGITHRISRPLIANFSATFMKALGLDYRVKYKPIEKLWGLRNLAQEQYKSSDNRYSGDDIMNYIFSTD